MYGSGGNGDGDGDDDSLYEDEQSSLSSLITSYQLEE